MQILRVLHFLLVRKCAFVCEKGSKEEHTSNFLVHGKFFVSEIYIHELSMFTASKWKSFRSVSIPDIMECSMKYANPYCPE